VSKHHQSSISFTFIVSAEIRLVCWPDFTNREVKFRKQNEKTKAFCEIWGSV